MKPIAKKGFTIVELVIVIAVIAILAAVLVPTFSNVVGKATMTTDKMAVGNMNTAISANYPAPDTFVEAMAAIHQAGIDAGSPASAGYTFVWGAEEQAIMLAKIAEDDTKTIVYPERYADRTWDDTKHFDFAAFQYFSTLENALSPGEADATADNAVAGAYTDNGVVNVLLLKDYTATQAITIEEDTNLNLGGHKLSTNVAVAITVKGGSLTIDGSLAGSGIAVNSSNAADACGIKVSAGNVTINGGTYLVQSDSAKARMIDNVRGTTITLENCDITTICGAEKNSICIYNYGTATLSNCNVKAYSNYLSGLAEYSLGILSTGSLTLNNCYIIGTYSAVQSSGPLVVDGGTYEGYGFGGFEINSANQTSYIRNATSRECEMPDGYNSTVTTIKTGVTISGKVEGNSTVYMDHCDIYGSKLPIVLRKSSNKLNNLYISNSRINLDYATIGVLIDTAAHKLYIGSGNNFTATDTRGSGTVETTNETYAYPQN